MQDSIDSLKEYALKLCPAGTFQPQGIQQIVYDIQAVLEELDKYRETLKFYADESNYEYEYRPTAPMSLDSGNRAREVLTPEKEVA